MIKITDIEALLSDKREATHVYYNVPVETLREVKRLYGGEFHEDTIENERHVSRIQNTNVDVVLHSCQKSDIKRQLFKH